MVDATNLRLNLRLVLELKRLGRPMLVALNMSDVAEQRGYQLDRAALEQALGIPVIRTVAVRSGGERALVEAIDNYPFDPASLARAHARLEPPATATVATIEATQREVRRVLDAAGYRVPARVAALARLDQVVLHPLAGPLLLGVVLFLMFQAVFSWAKAPQAWINAGVTALSGWLSGLLPAGPLRGLILEGVVAGTGSVLVFLPQILLLFAFILALEDSGYLPRAAFMLDRLMGRVGLSGRAFIPLLSSFACAIPGVMAARTIPSNRDRLATIMIAPLMTCSARLPVYALLIGAFIPQRTVGLHEPARAGAVCAVPGRGGQRPGRRLRPQAPWRQQRVARIAAGAARVSPAAPVQPAARPVGAHQDLHVARRHHHPHAHGGAVVPGELPGAAGRRPWSCDPVQHRRLPRSRPGSAVRAHRLQLADLARPGARAGGARGGGEQPRHRVRNVRIGNRGCGRRAAHRSSRTAGRFATGLSLLAWYVFAPQCLSTLAVVRRETNSWRYPLYMAAYLFALAYVAAFLTYRVALALGGGVVA